MYRSKFSAQVLLFAVAIVSLSIGAPLVLNSPTLALAGGEDRDEDASYLEVQRVKRSRTPTATPTPTRKRKKTRTPTALPSPTPKRKKSRTPTPTAMPTNTPTEVPTVGEPPSDTFGTSAGASNLSFWWSLGNDVNAPSTFGHLDGDPGLIKEGSDLWFYFANGGFGTQVVYRFKGTTMDNLVQQSNSVRDSSFNHPYGDDKYWIVGGWRDPATGKWWATVHVEFHYTNPYATWFRRIGLASSTDKGATWHYEGDIITSDSSYNQSDYAGSYFNSGQGDQKFFVDQVGGYFYVFYRNDWMNKTNFDDRTSQIRVARCPIASKMAPGCWKKWYNGSWSQPGLGGHETDIFSDADSASVFYNSYLGKFVAIGAHVKASGNFVAETTDLASQIWTVDHGLCDRIKWYNFPIDPSTWDKMVVGQTFRFYSSDSSYSGPTKYMKITFTKGSGTCICRTFDFTPEADSYIDSSSPSSTFGSSSILISDGSPIRKSFVRFNLTALTGKTILTSKIRLHTTGDPSAGSADKNYFRFVSNDSWSESSLSYNNPIPASAISTAILGINPSATTGNTYYTISLDPATVASRFGKRLSLELEDSVGTDGSIYYTRESGTSSYRPLLTITTGN